MTTRIIKMYLPILFALPLLAASSRVWVASNASNTVEVIDPATNKVVQTVQGIPTPHGIAFTPDGKRAFISSESDNALFAVDTGSGKIIKKIPFSPGRANVPTVTKDGKRIFVCISGARDDQGRIMNVNGRLEVIDTATLENTKNIKMKAVMHDCYTTPDGKYIVGGSFSGKFVAVVDVKTEEVVWQVDLGKSVTTVGIETNKDGSTKRLFVGLNEFRGFAAVDFAMRKEVARIQFPEQPGGFELAPPLERRNVTPTHGSAISPDGKTLAFGCRGCNAVFLYSLPELKLRGYVSTPTVPGAKAPVNGGDPGWVTFTPDGRLYVASAAANMVSAYDVNTLKEVARIPVGKQPDHLETLVLR